jgi:hypothetical protein
VRLVAALLAVALAPQPLFHLDDSRIDEASGIARGIASPNVVYVQNDSGDTARFFALDARTGATLATYTVPNATNVDWEDLAVARDRRGVPSIWIADIGDNQATRPEVRIYRVDEPHVQAGVSGVSVATGAPEVWRLRYPGGPIDAESLAVAPGGAAYIVTKALLGGSTVYAVPARPSAAVQTLHALEQLTFHLTGTPGGPNQVGQLTATGASMSSDGAVLAVRTYTDAYLWPLRHGDVATAVRGDPVVIPLPAQPQGEGIAVDGKRLLIDSEGAGSAVYAVPLPRLPTPRASGSTSPRATSPASSGPSAKASAKSARSTTSATSATSATKRGDVRRYALLGGAGVLVLVICGLGLWRARRRS